MTKFVNNNNKKILHYFHTPEKDLERVGPELNLLPEYYNCMNYRLICFNDSISVYIHILYTSIMFTRSSKYLSTGDTPYPHKNQRVSGVATTLHTE